ncbi:MAG: hypothetical protein AAF591_19900 [Verrucomicrobiota bacterium]
MSGFLADEWVQGKAFAHPDWERVYARIDGLESEEEQDRVWGEVLDEWVERLCSELGAEYRAVDSEHFVLISTVSEEKVKELLEFLERSFRQIQRSLPCLVDGELGGKCPVLVIGDHDLFYRYLSDYFDDEAGEYGGVGGVYLNRGYGHFAMPSVDVDQYIDVLSHELCHAMVAHLRLPSWLDEAIAMTVENQITFRSPYVLDREMVRRHQEFWDGEKIQEFWRGESFWRPDEGQELSYHLAQFLLSGLYQGGETPAEMINEFILETKREDAGAAAAWKVFEVELGDMLGGLLGEGEDWNPGVPLFGEEDHETDG